MASQKVTGWTKAEYLKEKYEHPEDHEYTFEEFYCLAEIPRQPEDYDGPTRYCKANTRTKDDGDGRHGRCRFHNGAVGSGDGNWEKSLEAADQAGEGNTRRMEHGMYAEDENLKENWSDADQKLFDRVMAWAEEYGFEEGSPEYEMLESLALSKVRELRSEKYLNEKGEVVEREQYDPETGTVETYEEVHSLSDNLRLKKQTILKMMKELGLTPKAKASMDESEAEAGAAEAMAEVASKALDGDGNDYDPEQFED